MSFVNAFGNGLTMTVSVLFFTRSLGFSVAQVGVGLTAAGVCGIVAGIPAGRLADRWGSRGLLIVLTCLEAAGMVAYVAVRSFPLFLLLLCAVTAIDRGASAVRNALYAEVLAKETRVQARAYLRAVTNVAIGIGAGLAALALQADNRDAYLTAIMIDAASFALVAVLLLRIPATRPGHAIAPTGNGGSGSPPKRRPATALRNRPYLVVTVLNGVLCLQFAMVEVGVPLWIVQATEAPRATVAAVLIVNTVLVVLLQVRATRGTDSLRGASRAFSRGGLLLALSCLLIAAASGVPAWAAVVIVLGGIAMQGLGEVLSQAGGWALSYDLADEEAHGAYQGVFLAGQSAGQMLGPALITGTALAHGLPGWAFLAALFAVSGLAMSPVVRWAERSGRRAGISGTGVA
ncbi:MFS transporter [Sphaerisporangium fuscum]|uniref:MFS transporter n=1 Tax=Sphaerisporangium fuscum TaxID=2835868 RepID=UPI001BDD7A83|nr:MFS transporter [Sphaerisporangium fuscum]